MCQRNAVALWRRFDGGDNSVQAACFDSGAGPVISDLSIPSSTEANTSSAFSLTATDQCSSPASVSWDFGDATEATGSGASHSYTTAGGYTVKATASDTLGNPTQHTQAITVSASGESAASSSDAASGSSSSTTTIPSSARLLLRLRGKRLTFKLRKGKRSLLTGASASCSVVCQGTVSAKLRLKRGSKTRTIKLKHRLIKLATGKSAKLIFRLSKRQARQLKRLFRKRYKVTATLIAKAFSAAATDERASVSRRYRVRLARDG